MMDKALRGLKGKTILDVYEDSNGGIYLILRGGTRIEMGYGIEIIPPSCRDCRTRLKVTQGSPIYLVCDVCVKKREERERERSARLRDLAMRDTPALAALRRQLET